MVYAWEVISYFSFTDTTILTNHEVIIHAKSRRKPQKSPQMKITNEHLMFESCNAKKIVNVFYLLLPVVNVQSMLIKYDVEMSSLVRTKLLQLMVFSLLQMFLRHLPLHQYRLCSLTTVDTDSLQLH